MSDSHETKRVSFARGPALILGSVLLVAGLYFLYTIHTFPKLSQFPSGVVRVDGKAFLGIFGLNGWSGELTAAAGGVLLFGAAQHLLAKSMSLIVAVILGVVAIIALVHHHSALGLFAANIWTIILWGGAAALLLANTFAPKTGDRAHTEAEHPEASPVQPLRPRQGFGHLPPRRASRPAQSGTETVIPNRGAIRIRPGDGPGSGIQEEETP